MIKLLFLFTTSLFASELIYDHSKIEALDSQLHKSGHDFGRPITPYFYSNNSPVKIFKNFNGKCTKVIFYANTINFKRISCNKKYNYILKPYPNYKLVSKGFEFKDEKRVLDTKTIIANYMGTSFKYHLRDLYDLSNLKSFKFSLTATSTLIKKDNSFQLIQNIKFQRDPFFFLPKRIENFTQTISYNKDDLLFKDSADNFILYKRYQPKPFTFSYMWLSDSYERYLNNIQSLLFESNNQSMCFMDNFYAPSLYDCEALAMDNKNFISHQTPYLFIL